MTTVIKTMDDIAEQYPAHCTITSLINDIAFQTNILALNAAVGGACRRTGQKVLQVAGRRHLASSANAANDIRKPIDASADKVTGSQQVHAGRTMRIVAGKKTSPS